MGNSFQLSDRPIDPAALRRELADPAAGACAIFEGWVRSENEGQAVKKLEYEAYGTLAVTEGALILAEAAQRFPIRTAHCVHRTGMLAVGDLAIWVGVTAGHRGAAFDACRYIIDAAKARVPIWKKEHYPGGETTWINAAGGK